MSNEQDYIILSRDKQGYWVSCQKQEEILHLNTQEAVCNFSSFISNN